MDIRVPQRLVHDRRCVLRPCGKFAGVSAVTSFSIRPTVEIDSTQPDVGIVSSQVY